MAATMIARTVYICGGGIEHKPLGLSGRDRGWGYGPINTALLHWKSISRANIRPTNVSSATYRPARSRLGHLAVTNLNLITWNEIGRTLLRESRRLNNRHCARLSASSIFSESFNLFRDYYYRRDRRAIYLYFILLLHSVVLNWFKRPFFSFFFQIFEYCVYKRKKEM